MPLDATRLSAAIRSGLIGDVRTHAVDNDALTALCDVIAAAVVTEVTTNAVVPALGLVAPGGGGPVTGAAVVT